MLNINKKLLLILNLVGFSIFPEVVLCQTNSSDKPTDLLSYFWVINHNIVFPKKAKNLIKITIKSENNLASENKISSQELKKLNSEIKSENQQIRGIWHNVFHDIEKANSLVGFAFSGYGRAREGSLTTITQTSSCKSIFNSQARYEIKRKISTPFYTAIDIDQGFNLIKTIFRIEKESDGKYLYIQ